jgi:N-methylhydantoinase A
MYQREQLPVGEKLQGPAIIAEQVATTWLAQGWGCEVDAYGNLMLSRGS